MIFDPIPVEVLANIIQLHDPTLTVTSYAYYSVSMSEDYRRSSRYRLGLLPEIYSKFEVDKWPSVNISTSCHGED